MAMRIEWTEWHLTPAGWSKGATRVHGRGNTWADEPEDRVLSYVYKEVETSKSPEVQVSAEVTWRSKTVTNVDELLRQYGHGPQHL